MLYATLVIKRTLLTYVFLTAFVVQNKKSKQNDFGLGSGEKFLQSLKKFAAMPFLVTFNILVEQMREMEREEGEGKILSNTRTNAAWVVRKKANAALLYIA